VMLFLTPFTLAACAALVRRQHTHAGNANVHFQRYSYSVHPDISLHLYLPFFHPSMRCFLPVH
jgi:hypothetical protein